MSTFLRVNVALGVASSVGMAVGLKLWGLDGWVCSLRPELGGGAVAGLEVVLGAVAFAAGSALFVWLYMIINRWLEDTF